MYFSLGIYNVISGYLLVLGHVKRAYTCAYRSDNELYFVGLATYLGIIWSPVIGSLEIFIESRILSSHMCIFF